MKRITTLALIILCAVPALAEDGPRLGFFKKSLTPLELLGPEGAKAVASVFAPDETLTWQLLVPETYDASKPAGVVVFVSWADWGSGKKTWSSVLERRNLIWIGLVDSGDRKPINERMLKAILARAVLDRDYKVDPERYYLFGYSGGAHVAAMLATSQPETFKGVIFHAQALAWGKNQPPKIDLMRKNRYVFLAGEKDDDRRKIERVARSYEKAGATSKFITVPKEDRRMLHERYVDDALAFLDNDAANISGAAE